MTDNQKRILEMLAENKISVDEASRLLSAVEQSTDTESSTTGTATTVREKPKYIRVQVRPNTEEELAPDAEHMNIRVPMALLYAGVKLTTLIPSKAVNEALKEKGIDFDVRNLKTEDIEALVNALADLEVDVRNGKEKVRIYVE
jgi:hypothetical protein